MHNKYDDLMDRIKYRYIRGNGQLHESSLKRLEIAIGYSLPPDYREFLSKFGFTAGGGRTHYGQFDNPDAEEEASVDVFYGIREDEAYESYDLQNIHEGFGDVLPGHLLAIASSPGGQILLSLAGDDAGRVYWWTPEWGPPDPDEDLIPLAWSFDTFVRSLRLHEE
jgi:hypothetical protein